MASPLTPRRKVTEPKWSQKHGGTSAASTEKKTTSSGMDCAQKKKNISAALSKGKNNQKKVPRSASRPGAATQRGGFSSGRGMTESRVVRPRPSRHHPAGELSSAVTMKTAEKHGEPRPAVPEPLAPIPARQRRRETSVNRESRSRPSEKPATERTEGAGAKSRLYKEKSEQSCLVILKAAGAS